MMPSCSSMSPDHVPSLGDDRSRSLAEDVFWTLMPPNLSDLVCADRWRKPVPKWAMVSDPRRAFLPSAMGRGLAESLRPGAAEPLEIRTEARCSR